MQKLIIHCLHKSHNIPHLPLKNLHRHCFRLLLGHFHVPGEIANNAFSCPRRNCKQWLCKSFFFLGGGGGVVREVYYGIVQVVNEKSCAGLSMFVVVVKC